MIASIPNLLTLSRILVIPALIGSFYLQAPLANWLALGLFVAAGITDFFDGYVARALGVQSKLGQFLDPVADKLLVAAALFMLAAMGPIDGVHLIAAVIILCREFLVSGLREVLADIKVSVPVSKLAKWKTTVQIVAIAFLLAGDAPQWLPAVDIGIIGLWIAAVLTMYTGYDYLRAGLRHLTGPRAP
ncbi:CDP-diacylglycerol--glycerol-3-phosphate 3-phosphatidyltransferase [Iodidimonas sp. SYSU 1G8]|uniref:CDP-diacylglycerol--glycerol-3-phosphate 3-phosphatidyltransferase n=1 Tax=Iodidimonas sp. SYSU 1G8 TaxID=3133967 RepID=UPI0031FEC8D0